MIYHVTMPYEGTADTLQLDELTMNGRPTDELVLRELLRRAEIKDVQMENGALGRMIRAAAILIEAGNEPSEALDTAMVWEWG